jgi:allene oxide cyclase
VQHTTSYGKRRCRALALAAMTAFATTAVAGAGSGSAQTVRAHPAAATVHVIEHANTDLENPGVNGNDVKGNILTFTNPVFDTADTKQVGRDEGFCTRLDPKHGIWECLWTTFLKGGQLTVQGPYYDTHNSMLSITGGTGAYRDARGQMKLKSRDGGKKYDFIFQIS